jgi:hypothetical protein
MQRKKSHNVSNSIGSTNMLNRLKSSSNAGITSNHSATRYGPQSSQVQTAKTKIEQQLRNVQLDKRLNELKQA